DDERGRELGRDAARGVADERHRDRVLDSRFDVAGEDIHRARRRRREIRGLEDVDTVDLGDDVAGGGGGAPRRRCGRGGFDGERAEGTRGVTPRNESTRAPSAARASTIAEPTDEGRTSSTTPRIVPISGAAPAALDANATSSSPRNVVCDARSPCPQNRSSRA